MTESDALRVGEARGRWVLLATILGSSMAMLDGTVVNLALPRIADDLDASFGGLQWILNGYTLALAALILLGGGLGDRFGRRRIFVIGAVGFTARLRAVRGLDQRADAGRRPRPAGRGRRHADAGEPGDHPGLVRAGGPRPGDRRVVGARRRGDRHRSVPRRVARRRRVVALDLPAQRAARHRRRHRRRAPRPRDRATRTPPVGWTSPGAVLGALALAGLTLGLSETSWLLAVAGVVLLVAFVLVERRTAQPLVPMALFSSRVVQRHQRRDAPALRRARRRVLPPRPRAAGPARLHAAAGRRGDGADHAGDAVPVVAAPAPSPSASARGSR